MHLLTCVAPVTGKLFERQVNRPWKGGTDGNILGGNYPAPPWKRKKMREGKSEGKNTKRVLPLGQRLMCLANKKIKSTGFRDGTDDTGRIAQ